VPPAFILDVDGTLVDSNYQHAIAWDRALSEHGAEVPIWRIHRHIGMGGDQLVAAVAGEEAERSAGDAIREAESRRYSELIGEVRVLPGARELITELARREVPAVLASSANEDEVDHYVELLDADGKVAGWTTSTDVEETKPEPDLIEAALEKAGGREAVMVADTVWDIEAAERAEIRSIGVLTGGFARSELSEAGAIEVYKSVVELRDDIDRLTR
jgi:HAD superfamily hydrolase (TIGR01549 family)